jgi:hypothetical protein
MICVELPARLGKLFVLMRSLYKAYPGVLMLSSLINYDWYYKCSTVFAEMNDTGMIYHKPSNVKGLWKSG